jgi:pimeloyl-ACP methyl ester carboxylesterase
VSPGSPFGFGGTKGPGGTPCYDDFAGSGGGLISPLLIAQLEAGDTGASTPYSPRNALRGLIVTPGFISEDEDELVAAMLETHLGDDAYPGDKEVSVNWPFVAPGGLGPNNAISPKYLQEVVAGLIAVEPKPPILWIRGSGDRVVADGAVSDPGTLGAAGIIPGWPGVDTYPPQPMLGQTRSVLDQYAEAGGAYEEVVIEAAAHVPFIEQPQAFDTVFHRHLETNRGGTS